MGIIKMKKASFEFNEEDIKEEHIFIKYRNISIKMTMKEFIDRVMQDQWHSLDESKPHENNFYLVYNHDPRYKNKDPWEAWWNGECFQDRYGGIYDVTYWREKPKHTCLPPISKSIRINPEQFTENSIEEYATDDLTIYERELREYALK